MSSDIDLNKLVSDLAAEHGVDDSVAVHNLKQAIANILFIIVSNVLNRRKDETKD